ncbi:MAG: SDR family oxidoreductase [Chloroflexota bacterium]
MSNKLAGRTALITGATKGIGRAIALAFAAEGADLVVTGRNSDELASLNQEVTELGVKCAPLQADLAEPDAVYTLWAFATSEMGDIHILVNNAGMGSSADPRSVIDYDDDFWDTMLYVNLTVPYKLSRMALPGMVERQHGRIINISSINGKTASFHGVAYAASKHGLLGVTRTIAAEYTGDGITCNAICPGPVRTLVNELRIAYDAERKGVDLDTIEKNSTLLGRRLDADEVSPLAVYLASDDSRAMTGQAINIDGGILMTG